MICYRNKIKIIVIQRRNDDNFGYEELHKIIRPEHYLERSPLNPNQHKTCPKIFR